MAIDPSLHPKDQMALIGHQAAHGQILRAFQRSHLHPAWLFAGERGIGKATLAYSLARHILGSEGQNPGLVARQIAEGTYPNFLAIERNARADGKMPQDITVEDVRKITPFLRQSAAISGWRVVIIDGAEEMNRNAANALLKILEEPPGKTVFFLVTHCLGKVLPTIRSRCSKLPLFPLTDRELNLHLPASIPQPGLCLARGSAGRAMAFHQAGGQTLLAQVINAIGNAVRGDLRAAQGLGNLFDKDDASYAFMLDLILSVLYSLIAGAHGIMDGRPPDKELDQISRRKPMSHWVDAYHRIDRFLHQARTSHLDRSQVIMAIFFMAENPAVGEEFIYG